MFNLIIETSLRDALQFSEILSDTPGLSNEFEREASNYYVARVESLEDAEELRDEVEEAVHEAEENLEFWSAIELDHEEL
jgi:hypothetical protein